VQPPIACNAAVKVDTNPYFNRDIETGPAVNDLTNTNANQGDTVDPGPPSPPPFQFLAGADNPDVLAGGIGANSTIMLSDSLVTVPVIQTTPWPPSTGYPNVQIIGFVQLFLNPNGQASPTTGPNAGHINTQVINLIGCGTGGTSTQTILGNGPSAVAVRLISQ
jgi:hypothetical protein